MSDAFWIAFFGFLGLGVAQWLNYRRMTKLTKVAEKTHVLVNSKMDAQLQLTAIALRRLAVATKDPEDDKAATFAENLAKGHDGIERAP